MDINEMTDSDLKKLRNRLRSDIKSFARIFLLLTPYQQGELEKKATMIEKIDKELQRRKLNNKGE